MRSVGVVLALVVVLAAAQPAQAEDPAIGRLGNVAYAATKKFVPCAPFVACVHLANAVVRADSDIYFRLARRIRSGKIKRGTACFREAEALARLPRAKSPLSQAEAWSHHQATKKAFVLAQLGFLRSVLKLHRDC